ncbi:Protein LURP-one-related 15 [Acorus calamus]|uniref:Protein LURP-one-related 15 n=1 Tax=Acorus calamus TaxID=4465 RepID=A0AAV9C4N4_ACOCL|nr:Protein LURP-one-related 15 [Acorus calamus]
MVDVAVNKAMEVDDKNNITRTVQQYCAPCPVNLTVRKKVLSLSGGDFVITNVNGALLLKVQGKFFSLSGRRVLVDGAGNPIVTMCEKETVIEMP